MVIRRTKPKKIRKVIANCGGDLAAATDLASTIHTVTDPGTLKRVIIRGSFGEDAFAADDAVRWGLCLTRAGETLPDTGNFASEEYRWLAFGGGLAVQQSDGGGYQLNEDMKIQRRMKDGDVLSCVLYQTTVGRANYTVTIFIDET